MNRYNQQQGPRAVTFAVVSPLPFLSFLTLLLSLALLTITSNGCSGSASGTGGGKGSVTITGKVLASNGTPIDVGTVGVAPSSSNAVLIETDLRSDGTYSLTVPVNDPSGSLTVVVAGEDPVIGDFAATVPVSFTAGTPITLDLQVTSPDSVARINTRDSAASGDPVVPGEAPGLEEGGSGSSGGSGGNGNNEGGLVEDKTKDTQNDNPTGNPPPGSAEEGSPPCAGAACERDPGGGGSGGGNPSAGDDDDDSLGIDPGKGDLPDKGSGGGGDKGGSGDGSTGGGSTGGGNNGGIGF